MKKIKRYAALAIGAYINCMALFTKERMIEKTFRLFCTPRKGKTLPEQVLFLESAESDLIAIGNTRVQAYNWPGDNATVLLMHGWESNSFRWHKLIPLLQRESYNIIAFDAPAHGNSSWELFNVPLYSSCAQAVIKKYQPEYVIGHSLGGMTLLYNQFINHNTCIEKIVTLGAPSELSDVMHQFQALLCLNTRVMKDLDDYFMKKFGFNFVDFSTAKFVKNITTKGLLIHDILDEIASIRSSEHVHANWKNSTLIRTTGLGHSLHDDKVSGQIVDFLKSRN